MTGQPMTPAMRNFEPCDMRFLVSDSAVAGDGVEESSRSIAKTAPYRSPVPAISIGHIRQRSVTGTLQSCRIVEFVAAQNRPGGAERVIPQETGDAIAQRQLAFGEAGRDRQQPGHGMHGACGVGKCLAVNHVAVALAMHRPGCGEAAEAPK